MHKQVTLKSSRSVAFWSKVQATMISLSNNPSPGCTSALGFSSTFESNIIRRSLHFGNAGKRQCNIRSQIEEDSFGEINRRDLLLGSTAGLPLWLINQRNALGAPILPPDLSNCKVSTPTNEPQVNCCLKTDKAYKDFKVPPPPKHLRVRPAAHLVDHEYVEKHVKAYELLNALPDDDNRKFINQAYVHCIMCDHVLVQPGTDKAFDIHFSWLFLAWYRWYLYFHERILQHLLQDPSFSLPFWNWDNQRITTPLPNTMPCLYTQYKVMNDSLRNTLHLPPSIANLSWTPGSPEGQDDLAKLRADNNAIMYQELVSGSKTASLFHGGAYRYGDAASNFNGSTNIGGVLENGVHGYVHVWCGADNSVMYNNEDMGALYSAAKDPIFYAHHGNIDRLWTIWRSLGRKDFTDKDWLDASFVFFDEFGDPVKVFIRDALTTQALGYKYQKMPTDWLTARATESGASTTTKSKLKAVKIPEFGTKSAGKSQELTDPFSSSIKLPQKKTKVSLGPASNSEKSAMAAEAVAENDGGETVLLIQDIELPMNKFVAFDVYINLPDADVNTRKNIKEYAGSFVRLPHMSSGSETMTHTVNVRLGIGETLEDLGIKSGDSFVVTLVPRGGGSSIVIKGFDVEFE